MKENSYNPCPVDVSDVELPASFQDLIEQVAENVHDVWASNRIKEGWIYGPERNDREKTHPCLVPYSELDEIEKEYDRNTAVNTLKLIVKLGYKINKD